MNNPYPETIIDEVSGVRVKSEKYQIWRAGYNAREAKHKIYVASKWEERAIAREIMTQLERAGHTITFDWTICEETDPGYPKKHAMQCVRGVMRADIFVGLFDRPNHYKGALVELGVAISMGMPIIIIGHAIDSCLFVHLRQVKIIDSVGELENEMSKM